MTTIEKDELKKLDWENEKHLEQIVKEGLLSKDVLEIKQDYNGNYFLHGKQLDYEDLEVFELLLIKVINKSPLINMISTGEWYSSLFLHLKDSHSNVWFRNTTLLLKSY
jgi:hypothetical protein